MGGEGAHRPERREEWRGSREEEADGRQTSSVVESCIQLELRVHLSFYFQSPAPVQTISPLPLAPCPLPSSGLNDILSPTSPCYPHPPSPVPSHLLHAYRTSCPEASSSLSPRHVSLPTLLNHPLPVTTFYPHPVLTTSRLLLAYLP